MKRHQAECDCGWRGPRRLLHGTAVVDTYRHAAVHMAPSGVAAGTATVPQCA